MSIEITKAKIIKGKKDSKTLYAEFLRSENDKSKTECKEQYNAQLHDDLISAFSKLDVFFALITENIDSKKIKNVNNFDQSLIESIHVSSFSIKGDEESPRLTLTGHKILSTGRALVMNAPFVILDSSEDNIFKFVEELESALENVKKEVIEYMNGKHAPNPQIDMFADKQKEEEPAEIEE